MLKRFLTVRWFLATLVIIAADLVLIRLGIWQLERLEQRRAFNNRISFQMNAPEINLNQELIIKEALPDLEYRKVTIQGNFDWSQSFLWRNQPYDGQPGFHMLVPFKVKSSSQAVLVDIGWIPLADGTSGMEKYRLGSEEVSIRGVIRRSQQEPTVGGVPDPTFAPGQNRFEAWNFIDIGRIQAQIPFSLLPVFIQQAGDSASGQLPARVVELPVLDEGPHLGYAVQWFAFAAILAVGYPYFVWQTLKTR